MRGARRASHTPHATPLGAVPRALHTKGKADHSRTCDAERVGTGLDVRLHIWG